MSVVRQTSRRFGRSTGTRTRSAADYSITATISVVPDPLETRKSIILDRQIHRVLPVRGAVGVWV